MVSEPYTPFTQVGYLFASLVRPYNLPGRRWGLKEGRMVAYVVQRWYTECSDIAMDAMVAVNF